MKLIHSHFYVGALALAPVRSLSIFVFQYIQYPFAKGLVEGGEAKRRIESNLHILSLSLSLVRFHRFDFMIIDAHVLIPLALRCCIVCCAHFGSVFSIYYYYTQTTRNKDTEYSWWPLQHFSVSVSLFHSAHFPFPSEFD